MADVSMLNTGLRTTWIVLCFIITVLLISHTEARTYNDPPYDRTYLEDDCQPFYSNDSAASWDKSVKNLTDGASRLYGYVQPNYDDVYRGPLNCAVKVIAPPGYKLIVRIPRVEIHHDVTGCNVDYISVIGASDELKYCGFGTVSHSIYSTSNYLIFKIQASQWDENHNYIGFLLYYTAVHYDDVDVCNVEGPNATEWRCGGMKWCTPLELLCDTKDNCGSWEEEKAGVCGLSEGAIVAISVVSVLVGGTTIFFIIYCIYNKQQHKKAQRRRQQEIQPTLMYGGTGGVTITPSPVGGAASLAEPPPPYTPSAYTNMGYDGAPPQSDPYSNLANANAATIATSAPTNIRVQYTTASSLRPVMGIPPPVYTAHTADDESADGDITAVAANGAVTTGNGTVVVGNGAITAVNNPELAPIRGTAEGAVSAAIAAASPNSGVSFEPLPSKQ